MNGGKPLRGRSSESHIVENVIGTGFPFIRFLPHSSVIVPVARAYLRTFARFHFRTFCKS
jgi:hypothetical protein